MIVECEEYSTIVNKKIFDPALNSETRLIEISYCDSTVRLVVGGKKAQAKEFPHMVCKMWIDKKGNYMKDI